MDIDEDYDGWVFAHRVWLTAGFTLSLFGLGMALIYFGRP